MRHLDLGSIFGLRAGRGRPPARTVVLPLALALPLVLGLPLALALQLALPLDIDLKVSF